MASCRPSHEAKRHARCFEETLEPGLAGLAVAAAFEAAMSSLCDWNPFVRTFQGGVVAVQHTVSLWRLCHSMTAET